jgi:hypothetical protein
MKPSLLSLAAALVLGLAAGAQEPAQNVITPQQAAAGWIQLFDGQTQFGWAPRGAAQWQVQEGTLTAVPGSGRGVLSTTTEFGDYHLSLDFWIDSAANSGVFLRCAPTGEISTKNGYEINIFDAHPQWPTGSINDVARVKKRPKTVGKWNHFDIFAQGDNLVVWLNGKKTVDVHNAQFARGTIGLQYNGEGIVKFRDVRLQPLGLESAFNGKDLSGWKAIPGRASVYTVTPEGWLNVKNGNGDLQSEAKYGDFLFQLDVISNGQHLNSGVFFRSEPGQFWSGYEAQVRNQWMGSDRTKPVDFGTGGVYNLQPARRVVSSDHEWFTMTIAAGGPHIAVWVNGIQVSDVVDKRPPAPSARQGYRAAPGVLSLQGHDPTTDLSFRNLRIKELPAARTD